MLHGNTPKTGDADVDCDGLVETSDVTPLVDIVLGKKGSNTAKVRGMEEK